MVRHILTYLFLLNTVVLVSQTNIQIIPSTTTPRIGEPFTIDIKTSGSGQCSAPSLFIEGAIAYGSPSFRSSSMNINGKVTSNASISYQFIPVREGKIILEPFELKCGGQTQLYPKIEFDVQPKRSKGAFRVTVKTNRENIYPGEELEVSLYLEFTQAMSGRVQFDKPIFQSDKHWNIEEIPLGKGQRTGNLLGTYKLENIDGTTALPRFIVPIYLNVRPMLVVSEPGQISLRQLPEPTPENFFGLIGDFDMTDSVTFEHIDLNSGTSVNIVVKGYGNLQILDAPDIDLNDWYITKNPVLYDKQVTDKGLLKEVNMEYELLPSHAGEVTFPPLELVYYNTTTEKYDTLASQTYSFNVEGGSVKTAKFRAPLTVTQEHSKFKATSLFKLFPEFLVLLILTSGVILIIRKSKAKQKTLSVSYKNIDYKKLNKMSPEQQFKAINELLPLCESIDDVEKLQEMSSVAQARIYGR